MSVPLLVASRNGKKLLELRRVLDSAGIAGVDVRGLGDVPEFAEEPENGATFAENALIKARSGARATGLACVADDSGICVDALSGMPGILSARWSGRHGDDAANNQLLLRQLADVPESRRGAAFVSVCALVIPAAGGASTREYTTEGQWPGEILREPRGVGGFGYDPLFLPEGSERTSAELSAQEKDAASHRGRALRALIPVLRELAGA